MSRIIQNASFESLYFTRINNPVAKQAEKMITQLT